MTRRTWTAAVSLLTVLMLTLLGSLIALPGARAADYPTGEWGTWQGATTHWGNILISGRYGYCVDPGVAPPTSLDDAAATRICGQLTGDVPDQAAQMAYLLARYEQTTDVQAAVSVSQFIRAEYHSGIPVTYQSVYDALVAEAKRNGGPRAVLVEVDAEDPKVWYGLARHGETDRTTAHYADGFTATLKITTPNATFTDGSQTLAVTTGTTAKSAVLKPRHPLIADEPVTVEMTVTDVPEACYLLYAQGSTQRVATPLRATLTGRGTGHPTTTRWEPKISTQIASTVVAKGTTTVADNVKADAVSGQWPVREWADAIQTQPKTYVPFTATGTVVRSTVPPVPSPTLPAGAAVVGGPVRTTVHGPGEWAIGSVPVPATGAGHYAVRWCLDAADQGGNAKYLPTGGPFCSDYFTVTERFLVPMTLAVSSTLPDQHRAKGQGPDDTITVSLPEAKDSWMSRADGQPAVVKVSGTFYAGSKSSFAMSDAPPADAKPLGTASVDVTLPTSGREPVTVAAPAGFTVPTSQYGTWVWQIHRADQEGEVAALFDNDPVDKFGQAGETHVTQMELTIRSEVKNTVLPEPAGDATVEICDSVWVEHTSPGDLWLNQWGTSKPVEVTVDGGLYRSAVPGAQTLAIGTDVPAVDDFSLTFTAAGKANAQTVCRAVGYGGYGAYGFAWSIDLAAQPAATKDYLSTGTATPLWLPAETTMVRRTPVIHTAATSWTTTNQGVEKVFLTDELWQTGWPDGPEDSDLHGAVGHGQWPGHGPWEPDQKTVTVELWRIEGNLTPDSCSAHNPAARLVAVNTATGAFNTWGASQKVSGSKFAADGEDATYTFVVSYAGDARTEPYRSVCGEKSETITIKHAAPEFVTELVTEPKGGSIMAAQARQTAIEVEAGAKLTDLLHVWFPPGARQVNMTGWTVTWDAYWQPTGGGPGPKIVTNPSGALVYDQATCTPGTLLASSGAPAPVTGPGTVASGEFTMPSQPGLLSVVETVIDQQGQVVRRGTCGLAGETAILKPPPQPAPPGPSPGQPPGPSPASPPKITTLAPPHAQVGEKITDEASLTGPFPKGATVEFWYQPTPFVNPSAARDELRCHAPDPVSMAGAVRIGEVVLDHAIAEGATETLRSPEFTSNKEGCTWIKEAAFAPGAGPGRETLAEGRFGVVNERTMWHQPEASAPTGDLPRTGPDIRWSVLAAGSCLAGGMGMVLAARRRRLAAEGQAPW